MLLRCDRRRQCGPRYELLGAMDRLQASQSLRVVDLCGRLGVGCTSLQPLVVGALGGAL
jgi:hypothetical protein